MKEVCEYCQGSGKLGFQQEQCCFCGGIGLIEKEDQSDLIEKENQSDLIEKED